MKFEFFVVIIETGVIIKEIILFESYHDSTVLRRGEAREAINQWIYGDGR